jgi:hypothetical protein
MEISAYAKPRRHALILASAMSLVFLTGCPNLTQVQQLATTVDGGKVAAATIAGDYSASCDRQNQLLKSSCSSSNRAEFAQIGTNLATEQDILFAYFDTLGKLASADATGFETAAPKLNTSFQTAGLTATQQAMAGAAGSLAADIAKIVTLGYREKEILEILKSADDPVQKLTNGLADQVAPNVPEAYTDQPCKFVPPAGTPPSYLTNLCNEDSNLHSYYDIPIASEKDAGTAILLQAQYDSALDQLHTRENSALAYRKLMLSLGTAHSKLLAAASKGNFDAAAVKEIAQALSGPMSDMANAVNTLQKDAR